VSAAQLADQLYCGTLHACSNWPQHSDAVQTRPSTCPCMLVTSHPFGYAAAGLGLERARHAGPRAPHHRAQAALRLRAARRPHRAGDAGPAAMGVRARTLHWSDVCLPRGVSSVRCRHHGAQHVLAVAHGAVLWYEIVECRSSTTSQRWSLWQAALGGWHTLALDDTGQVGGRLAMPVQWHVCRPSGSAHVQVWVCGLTFVPGGRPCSCRRRPGRLAATSTSRRQESRTRRAPAMML
jgi:hypothetical protein